MKTNRIIAAILLGTFLSALPLLATQVATSAATPPATPSCLDDEPVEVSLEKLKAAKYKKGKPLADWVTELDGKTIEIEGYMALGTLEGIKKFELVPESCECGRSKVNHFVEVTIDEGVTKYRPGRMKLVGTFSASEVEEDGFVKNVYRLKIKKLAE